MEKKQFLTNAAIIALTSLFMSVVGISFNVYISNKIGASGVGLFQLIMSIYGFSVTLATSGINLAATRLVADETASGGKNAVSSIMKRCIFYALCFGMLSFLILFYGAEFIAKNLLCDERVVSSVKALSFSMPPISMSSAMSGYFLAVKKVFKSSSAQIIEQIVKIGITMFLLGIYGNGDIEKACLCIVFGGSISEIFSFLYLLILYNIDKKKYCCQNRKNGRFSVIFKISVPIALSAYLRSALVTIEHLLIPRGLKKSGMDNETALKCYGTIHGMALPLLLFPSNVIRSVSGLLVPELSQCAVLGYGRQINHIASKILRIAFTFSICVSGIFFSFAEEIGMMVYKNHDAALYIRLLAPLCVVMYVDTMVDSMLKGLNQQVNSMFYNIIDSVVSILSILVLLPRFQGGGYIAAIFISELLNAFLSINRLIKITDFYVDYVSWILLPCISAYGAGSIVRFMTKAFVPLKNTTISGLFSNIAVCILIYIFLLYLFSKTKGKS